jgi:hypothetical protein
MREVNSERLFVRRQEAAECRAPLGIFGLKAAISIAHDRISLFEHVG